MTEAERFRDRSGREVTVTRRRVRHILDRHQDMAGRLDVVRATVETPEVVTRDVTHAHRENDYRQAPSGRRRTKVVIHYRPVPPQGT